MKLKNLPSLMGLRGRSKKYKYILKEFNLENDISIKYAQWLHPGEGQQEILDEQIKAYQEILKPGDFCIDIGAHSGSSTIPMAIAVGATGCVLALEPNPFVYHVLEKNVRANREIVNIDTMMAAATADECFMQFEYSDAGFCNGGRHEGISAIRHGYTYKLEVFGVNLAEELKTDYRDMLPKLKFIKVDTEGFDLFVIKSLSDIILKYRPYIKAEIFKKTPTKYRSEMFSFFLDNKFDIFKIDDEPIGIGDQLSLDNVNNWKHYDIMCVPH